MDALQIGGEMNELMSTKMCSPLLIYLAVIVTSGLSVYLTRDHLKRHNTQKMENLFNLYSLNELKFMIVLGLIKGYFDIIRVDEFLYHPFQPFGLLEREEYY